MPAQSPGEGTGLAMASFLQDQGHWHWALSSLSAVSMSGCLKPPLLPAADLIISLLKRFALLSSITRVWLPGVTLFWGKATALSLPSVLLWFWFLQVQPWPVANPPHAAAAALFPLQLQFPVLLEIGMFCCFFSPFLTSEVLDGHLLLQFILESCMWIWELSYISLLVACGFLSRLCVRAQTLVILG